MMTDMTAPQDFVELCERMYGPAIDPDVVWSTVVKQGPADADQLAQRNAKIRRNVERGSNAVGITAGTLGLAASVKDPRLAQGGRVARGIARTGRRVPQVAERIARRHPKLGGALAAGAVATQVANLGGDALIAGTLSEPANGQKRKVTKREWPGPIKPVVTGLRRAWSSPPAVTAPAAGTRAEAKAKQVAGAKAVQGKKDRAAGADVARSLSTTTGKVTAGAAVGLAGAQVTGGRRRSQSMEYAPDTYGKRYEEVTFEGTFSKLDTGKRLAFGWASVSKLNGVPVIDRQGDYIDQGDLEDAAYAYVHKSRIGGDMHRRTPSIQGDAAHKVSDMVESVVFTDEKCKAMSLPDDFPRGWWVGYKIHDDETWDLVRKGERTGFSIHGRGLRKAQDLDELMYAGQ